MVKLIEIYLYLNLSKMTFLFLYLSSDKIIVILNNDQKF